MQMHDDNRKTPHLSLVIPVYNGGKRMRANLDEVQRFLAAQSYHSELVLVDDGNAEAGAKALREFAACHPAVTLIRNETNRGKGFSVTRGMLAAGGAYRVFTDADLAFPLAEVNRILCDLEAGADVAIACRVLPESRYLMSPSYFHYLYTRHVMSRAFNLMVRWSCSAACSTRRPDSRDSRPPRPPTWCSRESPSPGSGSTWKRFTSRRNTALTVRQTAVYFRYDKSRDGELRPGGGDHGGDLAGEAQ